MDSDLEHNIEVAFERFQEGKTEEMIRVFRESDFFDDLDGKMSLTDMAMELDYCANGRVEKQNILRVKCVVAALLEADCREMGQADDATLYPLLVRIWVCYDSAWRLASREISDDATRELLAQKTAEFEASVKALDC